MQKNAKKCKKMQKNAKKCKINALNLRNDIKFMLKLLNSKC